MFLGIGCIIGAGIFVRTGNAAALHAGPAVLISYAIAGIICAFAGLCYAELASTLPVSGSAYTYSYATIGEFAAWVMGALLVLEYGLAASVVAVGWSGYVVSLLGDFGLLIPRSADRADRAIRRRNGVDGSSMAHRRLSVQPAGLPGLRRARAPAGHRRVGIGQVQQCHRRHQGDGAGRLHPRRRRHHPRQPPTFTPNWDPFIPAPTGEKGEFGWSGILRAASIVFFAYIGFEAVSTAGQEAKNPAKDMPFGIIGSLVVCTIIYILVSIVMTLIVPYTDAERARSGRGRGRRLRPAMGVVRQDHQGRRDHRPDLGHPGADVRPDAHLLHHGPRRPAAEGLLARAPEVPHAVDQHPGRRARRRPAAGFFDINFLGDATSVGTLAAFGIVCLTVIWLRRTHPEIPRGYKVPLYPVLPALGIVSCLPVADHLGANRGC